MRWIRPKRTAASANSHQPLTQESCNSAARFTSNVFTLVVIRPRAHKTLCARGFGYFELLISKKSRRRLLEKMHGARHLRASRSEALFIDGPRDTNNTTPRPIRKFNGS